MRDRTKILAFLQNPWFRPGTSERHIRMYREDQSFHRRVLAMSATGKALMRSFGRLYDDIVWENANPTHGTTRGASFPPDSVHMARMVAWHDPGVILLFGRQAVLGWERVLSFKDLVDLRIDRVVLTAPHPMAFGSSSEHLKNISWEVKRLGE